MKRTQLIAGVAALAVVATTFAAATQAEAKKGPRHDGGEKMTFEQLDANSDGKITADDLAAQHAARFAEMDTDGDGKISAEELTAHAAANQSERHQKRTAKMIERLDADKDGFLSAEELSNTERGERMFKRLDADGDGEISAEEFAAAKDKMKDRKGKHGEGKRGEGKTGDDT